MSQRFTSSARTGLKLADAWAGRDNRPPGYHRGQAFPNLFFLVGPNTGLGHNSIISA